MGGGQRHLQSRRPSLADGKVLPFWNNPRGKGGSVGGILDSFNMACLFCHLKTIQCWAAFRGVGREPQCQR